VNLGVLGVYCCANLQVTREHRRWLVLFAALAFYKAAVVAYNIWSAWRHPSTIGVSVSFGQFLFTGACVLAVGRWRATTPPSRHLCVW
jgi:hypothetical protein